MCLMTSEGVREEWQRASNIQTFPELRPTSCCRRVSPKGSTGRSTFGAAVTCHFLCGADQVDWVTARSFPLVWLNPEPLSGPLKVQNLPDVLLLLSNSIWPPDV